MKIEKSVIRPDTPDTFDAKVDAGVKEAIAEAVEAHRIAGRSIVVWREGKVVTIPASEIPPLITADSQP